MSNHYQFWDLIEIAIKVRAESVAVERLLGPLDDHDAGEAIAHRLEELAVRIIANARQDNMLS
ncbi:hypothetical protein [Bradyrhizobium sp. SZCCHNRI20481]|uniref:hypothetical protein n=1 Tax=Bradyrhizobium sp. SZCCHNRI20481 TaxID=3057286 RepID=UPI002915D998|nr:hypothetical protein [Bradyrhizobium sp. SZCCHNRI20481]